MHSGHSLSRAQFRGPRCHDGRCEREPALSHLTAASAFLLLLLTL